MMNKMKQGRPGFMQGLLALLAAVCMLSAGGATSPALAQTEAVLVLDHSGSMWARMDGEPKISVLRNAVGPKLHDKAGKLELGMLAYGTDKAESCETVKTIKALGPISPETDASSLAGVNPKASAPVARSLKEAAKLFKTKTDVRSIILVTDSADDCDADPCAAAKDIKAQSPFTAIHVIAFDTSTSEELQALSCVAENTRGIFQTATSGNELHAALEKAFELAEAGMTEDKAGRIIPVFASPSEGPGGESFASSEPGTLVLAAVLAEGTPPLSNDVVWRVYSGQVQPDGNYKQLHKFEQARTTVTLKPGDYLINAAYGRANLTKRVSVWPGRRTEDTFNLNAGGLRLYATLADEPLISEQSLRFDIFSDESDQFGNRRRVVTGAKSGVVLRLNSGDYRVESHFGDANSIMEVDVQVKPGKLTEATVDHQAGKVTFRLVEKAGGEALADTIWRIYSRDGQLVKKSGGAFPSHVLAAGDYSVRVEHGELEYAAQFSVAAGDQKRVEVVKPASGG